MSDSEIVISVENLSKRYLVGHEGPQERYHSLRDTIVRHGKNFVRKTLDMAKGKQIIQGDTVEEFWALKDVSFEVKRGEVLGIIGRNGAGKSTLLKVLSRITEPTSGRVTLKGRVASLLEVGTGFHPELTGRENIFLNAAILGMKRAEVKAKFDEIVDFAGVEKFLDTPVKRYSSGMYVRLAFAVAAHLDPEILIIDEVLAVGDAEFQKKCLGKMQDVAKGGRTVIFVSHNLGEVKKLCNRGILLKNGAVYFVGKSECVIQKYLNVKTERNINGLFGKYIASVEDNSGHDYGSIFFGDILELNIYLRNLPLQELGCNLIIKNSSGRQICLFSTNPHDGQKLPVLTALRIKFNMEDCRFAPGTYSVDLEITEPGVRVIETVESLYELEILPRSIGGSWAYSSQFGEYFPKHEWNLKS